MNSPPSPPPPPLLLFPFFFFFTFITSHTTITPGSTLHASNPTQFWTSPTTTFSLRFIPAGPTTFFAALTFNFTFPLWLATTSAADSTATLQFLPDGNLRLLNGSSSTVVWESGTAGLGVSSAAFYDSGNFALLKNATVSVWSTFDNPTDTILPSQLLTNDKILRSGFYTLGLSSSENVYLKWNDSIVYWNFRLKPKLVSPRVVLESTGVLLLFDSAISSPVIVAYASDYKEGSDVFRFLKLDNDGNLRIYSFVGGTRIVSWVAVNDQCQVFGYCGDLGICSYNDSGPVCGCPSKNFDPIDERDSRKGCRRKVEIKDCPGNVTMLRLEHAKFLTYPPELPPELFYVGISACELNCLKSTSCIASTALTDGTGSIYMKFPHFVSGYQSPALPSTSFVKVCGPVILNHSGSEDNAWRLHAWIVILVVIGTVLGFIVLEGGLWLWCCRRRPKFGSSSVQFALLNYASGAPVLFTYKELQYATKGFKEKLGAGGLIGAVYRGVVANRTVVAVKQLEGIEQGEKQFRMAVATISSTHHLNLVNLIGYCSEGRHRLLVYEFMKNRSLDSFLYSTDQQFGKLLNWDCRFNIALGTAKGITYLHEECRACIVHCALKPENILLDENYNAKVSDFGLARLVNFRDRYHRYQTLTNVSESRGYLAPEWLANLPVTSKVDVYSYGMVLLEIVSGRRNFEVSAETNWKKFLVWAYEEFERGNVKRIVDKRLVDHEVVMEQVIRAILVSFWCIQEQPSERPTIRKVVQMLEGMTQIEMPPAPKVCTEGSVSGTNGNEISYFNVFSTFPSSSPSFQTAQNSSFVSEKNTERASSSL